MHKIQLFCIKDKNEHGYYIHLSVGKRTHVKTISKQDAEILAIQLKLKITTI